MKGLKKEKTFTAPFPVRCSFPMLRALDNFAVSCSDFKNKATSRSQAACYLVSKYIVSTPNPAKPESIAALQAPLEAHVTISVPVDLGALISQYAKEHHLTPSKVVRLAIYFGTAEE